MEFVGFDRGLTIATLAIENRTGTRSGWPSSPSPFMVIAVPRDAVPPAPLVRELRVSERTVTLSITPDVTGTTRSLAVYRARNSADASDVRRMKPVTEVTVSAANDPISVIDTGLYDEVDYFYRVVAISEGGLRSAPSGVLCARPIAQGPPPAPVVSSIERDPGSLARRMVRLLVPRRDYSVFLFRRPQFAPNWEAPTGPSIGIDGKLDLAVLASRSVASGYEVAIDDFVPAIDALYSYFARIEDPRGRVIAGPPLTEAP